MRIIQTDSAPAPAGHYSQGVAQGDLLFVSGMLPVDPTSGDPQHGTMAEQAELALSNVEAVLKQAGTTRDKVLKATVYVSDIEHWPEVNRIWADFFGDHKPARAVVPTRDLHFGLLVEIECVAALA